MARSPVAPLNSTCHLVSPVGRCEAANSMFLMAAPRLAPARFSATRLALSSPIARACYHAPAVPPSLTEQAERLRKLAGVLKDKGLVDVAVELLEIALDLQAQSLTGGEGGSPARLRESKRSPILKREMKEAHRLAISEGHNQSKPMKAARAAGYPTLQDVAEALGATKSFVSQVFSRKKPMPQAKARLFEQLTGYPASHWES